MLFRRDVDEERNEHIDMTPMVDVVFQLMTFMLFSVQMTGGEKVDVPPARHGVGVEEIGRDVPDADQAGGAGRRDAAAPWASAKGRRSRSSRRGRRSPTGPRRAPQGDPPGRRRRSARRGRQGRRRGRPGRRDHRPPRRSGADQALTSAAARPRSDRANGGPIGELGRLPRRSPRAGARPEHGRHPRGAGARRRCATTTWSARRARPSPGRAWPTSRN